MGFCGSYPIKLFIWSAVETRENDRFSLFVTDKIQERSVDTDQFEIRIGKRLTLIFRHQPIDIKP